MRKRLSLLFAAAMVAFSMQAAMAMDADDMDMDDADVEEVGMMDDDAPMMHPRRMGRPGPGPDGFRGRHDRGPGEHRWGGGPGHGPMMHHGRDMKGMGKAKGMGMFGPRFMERLDLDATQKAKIVDIMTNCFRDRLTAGIEMADAQKKLRDLRDSEKPDHEAIVAAHQALGAARGKMEVIGSKMRQDVRAILTPEQIKKLDDMDKRGPRMDRDKKWDGKRDKKWDDRKDDKRPPRPDRDKDRQGKLETGPGPQR